MPESTKTTNPQPTRLADMVAAPAIAQATGGIPTVAWVKVVIFAALFAIINYQELTILVETWSKNPNWTHGFIIPLFSLYLLFSRREELFAAKREGSNVGLVILALGLFAQVLSVYPLKNDWCYWLSMIPVIFGLVVFMGGWSLARVTWVPIFYLALAMPFPDLLYSKLALPLQELAATAARVILSICGVSIQQDASTLHIISVNMVPHDVTVAEACSGVQSLMAYLALAIAMAYLEDRPWWQRLIFALSAIPIAIFCNILRVLITCEMFVIDKPELGQKFMHEVTGMLMLIPAFLMFWCVGRLLRIKLFEEVDEDEPTNPDQPKKQGERS